MGTNKIFLVPGFFGFTSIGSLNYFHRVAETLDGFLRRHGVTAEIVECRTQPTGSIRNRAERLLDEVIDAGGLNADHLHFVGHSTGGLDIRLLVTPGVRLRPGDLEAEIGRRTRTVVTVSTPHFGTPLASFFTTLQGRNLLRFLSVMATSNEGRYAIFLGAQLTSLLAQVDDRLGRRNTLLDFISGTLLRQLTLDRTNPLWRFLEEVSSDQGAIIQLTPEGTNLFNAAVIDREGTRYGSLVAAAPPPRLTALPRMGSLERATRFTVFAVLHTLTGREHRHYPYPNPASALEIELQRRLPFDVSEASNDGIVPTLSQIYGELIDAIVADHLDVVGQFRNAGGQPYADWLPSGSRFDDAVFQRAWEAVAEYISRGQRQARQTASARHVVAAVGEEGGER